MPFAAPPLDLLHTLVAFLVARDYQAVSRLTNGGRLSPSEMQRTVVEYGRRLVPVPEEGWALASVVPIRSSAGTEWSVWFPLWTAEEGRSDLQVELRLAAKPGVPPTITLDDIRVP